MAGGNVYRHRHRDLELLTLTAWTVHSSNSTNASNATDAAVVDGCCWLWVLLLCAWVISVGCGCWLVGWVGTAQSLRQFP